MSVETQDYLIALNLKHEIVLLPLTERTEFLDGIKSDYYETTLKERVFILGYTYKKLFQHPGSIEFSPIEQYFYNITGFQTSFLKQKYFREDTELISIKVLESVPSGPGVTPEPPAGE